MNLFIKKYNIRISGNLTAKETLVFAHGFGSEQTAWRMILPAFQENYRLIVFDLIGSSFLSRENFNIHDYNTLWDYAEDLIKIGDFLELHQARLIAHSASCMIGTLAALKRPDLFKSLVFISASPRYLDEGDYLGGLTQAKVVQILEAMTTNYSNWIRTYSAVAMNNPQKPYLAEEFANCLVKLRPDIALVVFNMIISSDYRREVAKLELPTLIIQPQNDVFVPPQVGEYLHRVIKNSQLHWIMAKGHFPHLSNPSQIIQAISDYLR